MAQKKVSQEPKRTSSLAFAGGILATGVVVVVSAVLIGKSDSGPINVAATIQESNQAQSENGGEQVNSVSQTFQNMPNGGLVPQENQTDTTPAPEPTATTTDETASTTSQEGSADAESVNTQN